MTAWPLYVVIGALLLLAAVIWLSGKRGGPGHA